jgi:hypothetical protein
MNRAIALGMLWKFPFPPGIDILGSRGEVEDVDKGDVVAGVD